MSKSNTRPGSGKATPERLRTMALEERLLLDPPQAAGSDLGFDSPWWILYQALVWVAVRSREAVDMAGREPGSHIFAAINNTGGRRMGAAEAAREIHNAMSDGRLNGVRLEDSRAVPVAKHEWASIPFDLSEAGAAAPHGIWWLNYRLSSAAVRKLWPDAADEVATAALARVDQPQAGAAKDAGGRPRKHDKDQFLHEIIRI